MTLTTIAIKNIRRRKGKMALVVFGLALAVATLVSIVSMIRAFEGQVNRQLDEYGFNIILLPKAKNMLIKYGDITIGSVSSYRAPALGQKDVDVVAAVSRASGRVRIFSPKLLQAGRVKGKRALLAGVDLAVERRVKSWWVIEAGRYPSSADEIFVGQTAAEKLGLELGDQTSVAGHSLRVAGILMETGSQDDQLVFVDVEKLREITKKPGQVTLVEVAAKSTEDVGPLAAELKKRLPNVNVQSVKKAVEYKENALGHLVRFGLGVTAAVVFISALIVFTMMASAVNERRVEIGIFRAIGFRQRNVATIILTEALVLGVVAGLAGYLIGFGLAQLLPVVGKGAVTPIRPEPLLLVAAVGLSVIIGLVASLIPARRAAGLDPVESLKSL